MTSAGNPTELTADQLESLLKDPKSTTEFRILRATRRLLAREGLGISIDAVADEAGLGRRTVFRHFATRDELVARALSESLSRFHTQVADALSESTDFDQWLTDVVSKLLGSQSRAGAGLWQLAASNDEDLPEALAVVNRHRREARRSLTQSIARAAWNKVGGSGAVPRSVELAFALSISSFAIHSLDVDYESQSNESVAAVVEMLAATVRSAAAR